MWNPGALKGGFHEFLETLFSKTFTTTKTNNLKDMERTSRRNAEETPEDREVKLITIPNPAFM